MLVGLRHPPPFLYWWTSMFLPAIHHHQLWHTWCSFLLCSCKGVGWPHQFYGPVCSHYSPFVLHSDGPNSPRTSCKASQSVKTPFPACFQQLVLSEAADCPDGVNVSCHCLDLYFPNPKGEVLDVWSQHLLRCGGFSTISLSELACFLFFVCFLVFFLAQLSLSNAEF